MQWRNLLSLFRRLGSINLVSVVGILLLLAALATIAGTGYERFPPRNGRDAAAWVQAGGTLLLLFGAVVLTVAHQRRLAVSEARRQIDQVIALLAEAQLASENGFAVIEQAIETGHAPRLGKGEVQDAVHYLGHAVLLPLPGRAVFVLLAARRALAAQIDLTDTLDGTEDWPGDVRMTIEEIRNAIELAATSLEELRSET